MSQNCCFPRRHTNVVPLVDDATGVGGAVASACPYIVSFYDAFINPDEVRAL